MCLSRHDRPEVAEDRAEQAGEKEGMYIRIYLLLSLLPDFPLDMDPN